MVLVSSRYVAVFYHSSPLHQSIVLQTTLLDYPNDGFAKTPISKVTPCARSARLSRSRNFFLLKEFFSWFVCSRLAVCRKNRSDKILWPNWMLSSWCRRCSVVAGMVIQHADITSGQENPWTRISFPSLVALWADSSLLVMENWYSFKDFPVLRSSACCIISIFAHRKWSNGLK